MTINERIKAIQEVFEIKGQKAFATRIGIAQSSLNSILNGADPKFSTVEKLITAFPDISPEWLLCGTGNMIRQNSTSVNIDMRHQNQGDFSAMDNGTVNVGDMETANKAKALSIVEKIVNAPNVSAEAISKAVEILEKII